MALFRLINLPGRQAAPFLYASRVLQLRVISPPAVPAAALPAAPQGQRHATRPASRDRSAAASKGEDGDAPLVQWPEAEKPEWRRRGRRRVGGGSPLLGDYA
jgi:hypothetical protein